MSEVNWVDESVAMRLPVLYVPSYYRAAEVSREKLIEREKRGIEERFHA